MAVLGTVCVLFGALLVLGLYRVQGTANTASASRFGIEPASAPDYLDADDPVARFTQTGVGHVLFSPRAGDHCQRVLFDNRTGAQYDTASVDCARPAAEVVASTDRMGALGRTFRK